MRDREERYKERGERRERRIVGVCEYGCVCIYTYVRVCMCVRVGGYVCAEGPCERGQLGFRARDRRGAGERGKDKR